MSFLFVKNIYSDRVRKETGIRIPRMLDIDVANERILKEYIDYECNNYMDEWNFENWGIKYWSKTTEFIDYMEQH